MKTAVSIPDKLFKEAEAEAKRMGVSRSKLHQLALESFLNRQSDTEITRRLNESYSKHPEPVDPFMQSLAAATMRRMELDEDEEGRDLVDRRRRSEGVRARIPATRRNRVGK